MFADWLKHFASQQDDLVIAESETNIGLLKDLLNSMPPVVKLNVVSAEQFVRELRLVTEIGEIVHADPQEVFDSVIEAYWRDQAGLAAACRSMVMLRCGELLGTLPVFFDLRHERRLTTA